MAIDAQPHRKWASCHAGRFVAWTCHQRGALLRAHFASAKGLCSNHQE